LFNWGFTLIKEKKIDNFITKFFFIFPYIIFGTTYLNISYNHSYWINFHGNGGFVGRIIKEFFYSSTNIIDNQYINLSLLILAIAFFILSLNLINEKALIIFDNVLWHGEVFKKNVTDEQTNIMREFNKYIKNDYRVEKIILPLGDGLTICRKI